MKLVDTLTREEVAEDLYPVYKVYLPVAYIRLLLHALLPPSHNFQYIFPPFANSFHIFRNTSRLKAEGEGASGRGAWLIQ